MSIVRVTYTQPNLPLTRMQLVIFTGYFQPAEYTFSIVFDDPQRLVHHLSLSCLRSCDKLLRNFSSIAPASPFREKPTTTRFIHVLFNRLEYHLTSSYLRLSSFLPSPLLLSLSDRGELFRRDGEESSLAWNIPIEIVFLFVYQEFKLKIGKEIILSNFSSPFSKGIRLSSN